MDIGVSYSMFFDAPSVQKKVKDGNRSALAKFGAYVRTSARSSIRSRKKPAAPGSPPSSHTGTLKNQIFFGYDSARDSVVVGPTQSKGANPTVPHLLEFGGTTIHWRTKKPATYRAFPFMQPALDKNQDKFAGMFTGCVR